MEVLALLVVIVTGWFILRSLGIIGAIKEVVGVAERESVAYNREHKKAVAVRYMAMGSDIDVEMVNANIAKIDAMNFD
jgi:hypothetical protein